MWKSPPGPHLYPHRAMADSDLSIRAADRLHLSDATKALPSIKRSCSLKLDSSVALCRWRMSGKNRLMKRPHISNNSALPGTQKFESWRTSVANTRDRTQGNWRKQDQSIWKKAFLQVLTSRSSVLVIGVQLEPVADRVDVALTPVGGPELKQVGHGVELSGKNVSSGEPSCCLLHGDGEGEGGRLQLVVLLLESSQAGACHSLASGRWCPCRRGPPHHERGPHHLGRLGSRRGDRARREGVQRTEVCLEGASRR